jgi:hypothetical protein
LLLKVRPDSDVTVRVLGATDAGKGKRRHGFQGSEARLASSLHVAFTVSVTPPNVVRAAAFQDLFAFLRVYGRTLELQSFSVFLVPFLAIGLLASFAAVGDTLLVIPALVELLKGLFHRADRTRLHSNLTT